MTIHVLHKYARLCMSSASANLMPALLTTILLIQAHVVKLTMCLQSKLWRWRTEYIATPLPAIQLWQDAVKYHHHSCRLGTSDCTNAGGLHFSVVCMQTPGRTFLCAAMSDCESRLPGLCQGHHPFYMYIYVLCNAFNTAAALDKSSKLSF